MALCDRHSMTLAISGWVEPGARVCAPCDYCSSLLSFSFRTIETNFTDEISMSRLRWQTLVIAIVTNIGILQRLILP